MPTSTHTEYLPVPLSDAEKLAMGGEIIKQLDQLDTIESELKNRKEAAKEAKAAVETRLDHLRACLRDGTESRKVRYYERFRYEAGIVERVREDTGVVFSTRMLEPGERQQSLDELLREPAETERLAELEAKGEQVIERLAAQLDDEQVAQLVFCEICGQARGWPCVAPATGEQVAAHPARVAAGRAEKAREEKAATLITEHLVDRLKALSGLDALDLVKQAAGQATTPESERQVLEVFAEAERVGECRRIVLGWIEDRLKTMARLEAPVERENLDVEDDQDADQVDELDVDCPRCLEPVGEGCRQKGTKNEKGKPLKEGTYHPERTKAAEAKRAARRAPVSTSWGETEVG